MIIIQVVASFGRRVTTGTKQQTKNVKFSFEGERVTIRKQARDYGGGNESDGERRGEKGGKR